MSAIAATFSDFKLVKTRKCAQLVLEVPIEQADAALAALGGLPRSDAEKWVGIAPLEPSAVAVRPADGGAPQALANDGDKPGRRPFHTLPRSQQAAIKCGDEAFRRWLAFCNPRITIDDADMADEVLKTNLRIGSKRELDTDHEAGRRWDELLALFEADTGRMAERR